MYAQQGEYYQKKGIQSLKTLFLLLTQKIHKLLFYKPLEPYAMKVARTVLRGGKIERSYLSQQKVAGSNPATLIIYQIYWIYKKITNITKQYWFHNSQSLESIVLIFLFLLLKYDMIVENTHFGSLRTNLRFVIGGEEYKKAHKTPFCHSYAPSALGITVTSLTNLLLWHHWLTKTWQIFLRCEASIKSKIWCVATDLL